MSYKDSIILFDKIASHGIPIRHPDTIMVWARKALFQAYQKMNGAYKGTVSGAEKLEFFSDDQWDQYISEGFITPVLNKTKCEKLWDLFGYSTPRPSFSGSVSDMQILSAYEDEYGFAGDLYSLFKKRQRLTGLCGSWLSSYKQGRVYYGSLKPFACSTGRCAPCPSDGFLPGMGREVTKALLNPPKGREISILDYKAQGLCIMAALSHDPAMMALARAKKDPYLGLGKILGIIPETEYNSHSKDDLKTMFPTQRDQLKRLMLGYQYGAGPKRLELILPKFRGEALKRALDRLFSVYVTWRKGLPHSFILPDGFEATGTSPSVTHVQGTDAYILRRLITEIELPGSAFIIATNHDLSGLSMRWASMYPP